MAEDEVHKDWEDVADAAAGITTSAVATRSVPAVGKKRPHRDHDEDDEKLGLQELLKQAQQDVLEARHVTDTRNDFVKYLYAVSAGNKERIDGLKKTLDSLESYLLDEWHTVKQATTPAAADKMLPTAKTDLRDAEQRLTSAEQRLAGAKTDLRDAERRLREADQRLRDAKLAGPSVDAWLETGVTTLHLQTPISQRFKRVGRYGFDRELARWVNELTEQPPIEMQLTAALVLASASGVGKTFASLTFRAGAKRLQATRPGIRYDAVSVYIGLNCGWSLTTQETALLQQSKSTETVEAVILQRTLLALTAMSAITSLADLDEPTHDCQRIALPAEIDSTPPLSPLGIAATEEVRTLICTTLGRWDMLPDRQKGAPLVVLVCLDEAQFLDKLIPPIGDSGGARFALRALRKLQRCVWNRCKVVILPLATGIRPQLALSEETEGQNSVLQATDATLMSFSDFTALHKELRDVSHPDMSSRDRLLEVALTYPIVRHMILQRFFRLRERLQVGSIYMEATAAQAFALAKAAFEGSALPIDDVPLSVPIRRTSMTDGIVALPFGIWGSLYTAIARELEQKGCDRVPDLPVTTVHRLDQEPNYHKFEDLAFRTIGLFLACFGGARWPTTMHPCLAAWLPAAPLCIDQEVLEFAMSSYHPFVRAADVKTACETGILSREADARLTRSLEGGRCAWMRCGGSAPVDFILVARKDSIIRLRFMDAKHSEKSRIKTASIHDVESKAEMVHQGLVKALKRKFATCDVEPFAPHHCLIITNDEHQTNAVSPATFTWQPWTNLLFLPEIQQEV